MGSQISPTLDGLLLRSVVDGVGYKLEGASDTSYSTGYNDCVIDILKPWEAMSNYCEALSGDRQIALEYLMSHEIILIVSRQMVSLWIITESVGGAFTYVHIDHLEKLMQLHVQHGDLGVLYWISNHLKLDPIPKLLTPEFISLKEKLNTRSLHV
jgi:hypothetical protein